jgi:hypothetical protein
MTIRQSTYRVLVNTSRGPLVVNDTPGTDDVAASFAAVEKARALGFTTSGVKSCKRTDTIALHIGSLANATLEPLTDAPHSDGSHVTLDARNADHWSRNHGR